MATAQPIANGTYTLAPANATGQRLDVSGQGTADSTNVQIWQFNSQLNQQWIFTNTGGSTYRISPAHATSKCLDVSVPTNPPSGTNVHIYEYWGNPNQKWTVTAVTGGYTLTPTNATGLRLNNTGTANGANVNVTTANSSTAQRWSIVAVGGGGTAPAAPNLTSATAGNAQVSLTWSASSGATSYSVYRSTTANNTNPTLVQSNVTSTSYTNTGLTNGTTYYFKVRAVNSVGSSGFSNERSAIPTSSSTPGAPDPGTAYVPAGLSLTFSDEFNGTTLDTGKWNRRAPWNTQHLNDEIECYEDAGVIISGGLCNLRASRATTSCGSAFPWRSGAITTNGAYRYGYYEARIRVPQGKGMWPAFWLTSSTRWPPEWDIVEIPNTVGTLYQYLHLVSGGTQTWQGGAEGSDSTYTSGEGMPNPYTGYVIYGCQWTSTTIKYWVNGRLTAQWGVSSNSTGDFMWVSCNLAVGGNWAGAPDSTTPNPSNMYVDYVRIYQ